MYNPTISSEEINLLPRKEFAGRILVVDSEQTMAQAVELLKGESVLGFDTETRPAFKKGLIYDMALVQLSTSDTAILIRLQKVEMPVELLRILESPDVIKVGAAIRDDIRGMQRMKRFSAQGFVDLQGIVGEYGIQEISVRKMAALVLGIKVSKAQRLSNWEAVTLTEAQQDYAAMDAWVCREIYMKLMKLAKEQNDKNNTKKR